MMNASNFVFQMFGTNITRKGIIERETVLQKKITKILNALKKEPKAVIFLQKVTKKEAPNYFEVIERPMDLGTMTKKVHLYRNMKEFKDDLDLIWSNCLKYNTVGDYYRDCAISMSEIADSLCVNRGRVFPCVLKGKEEEQEVEPDIKNTIFRHISGYMRRSGFEGVNSRVLVLILEHLEQEVKKTVKFNKKSK